MQALEAGLVNGAYAFAGGSALSLVGALPYSLVAPHWFLLCNIPTNCVVSAIMTAATLASPELQGLDPLAVAGVGALIYAGLLASNRAVE